MERHRTPRRRPGAPSAPTTLTEIARRYVACGLALSRSLGLPWTEDFLRQHRESITTCFIEASKAGVRLPATVQLPPLVQATGGSPEAPVSPLNSELSADGNTPPKAEVICVMTGDPALEPTSNGHTPPPTIPKDSGLPCGGVLIGDLKPAQLAMLISKVATLVHAEGERWVPLLGALQVERAQRLERGRKAPREG